MSFRLLVSLFLLGVGLGSPWLVRDWLDVRGGAGQEPPGRPVEGGVSFSDRWKGLPRRESESPAAKPEPGAVSSARPPYPLASRAQRIMQGFLPSSPGGSGEKVPFVNSGGVPATPRTRLITMAAGERLRGELADLGFELGDPAYLRVFKEESELELWLKSGQEPHYALFKIFRLSHCAGEPGPKLREGDGQAPEGFYFASSGSLRPETRHHLGIDLGFPNAYDADRGYSGSDLMIHGGSFAAGAFALAPQDMEEVYTLVEAALERDQEFLRINLFPFRMTDKRMDQVWESNPSCLDFWTNLKEGYDFFENVRHPPMAEVVSGRYAFRMEE